ncbi:hypothetical protein Nepgr_031432 [Nepenthes gracilis]|uniref:Uncharacterized protein n=1 Tax=Nepenthes gracilis TaxID=150966 RepID=A0AAD3TI43_NEPGR|nr:hypothetical protein Nepgr_031432 [Nepenthes gracilis]
MNEELAYVANNIDHPMLDVGNADASSINARIADRVIPPPDDCLARLVGDVYENDEAHYGSMSDKFANVDTNSEHPELDEGAQNVADHAAGSNGVANSVVIGPILGVDDSTPESIARITRKCSLAEAVDVSLIKAPLEFPDDSSCPLPGCPVEAFVDSMAGAVLPCILERGLVHTLPISTPKPELCDLGTISQVDRPPARNLASVRCMSPGVDVSPPAEIAKSSVTMDAGWDVAANGTVLWSVLWAVLVSEAAEKPFYYAITVLPLVFDTIKWL